MLPLRHILSLRALYTLALFIPLALAGCSSTSSPTSYAARSAALAQLAQEPLNSQPWEFARDQGLLITTQNYRIYTTIKDPLYQRLLVKTLEAAYAHNAATSPGAGKKPPLECYVFATRAQWELYTKLRAGNDAAIYLQITAGGYCQKGVFAGYDIGREQTLNVVAHESWHQYSWFTFKDHLPSWLEEGLATQNESIEWNGATPVFKPELNHRRWMALRAAVRENRLWKIEDLLPTHAGRAIAKGSKQVDAYYAQLWSLTLFLQNSPKYSPGLNRLLEDANHGLLTRSLGGAVSQRDINNFTERWNEIAGPIYMKRYISSDIPQLQRDYEAWLKDFAYSWPPKTASAK